jgi:hypothetical protein
MLTRLFGRQKVSLSHESDAALVEIRSLEKDTEILDTLQSVFVSAGKQITRNELTELKSFTNPPEIVQRLFICLAAVLNEKADWGTAKNVIPSN